MTLDPRRKGTTASRRGQDVKRQREALEGDIREAFCSFIDGCRAEIAADGVQAELNEDLREVARLLDKRRMRERARGTPKT